MARAPEHDLRERAHHLADLLVARSLSAEVRPHDGYIGGGASPMRTLPGFAVFLPTPCAESVAKDLRTGTPAIVPRVVRGELILDPRTLPFASHEDVANRVQAVCARPTRLQRDEARISQSENP